MINRPYQRRTVCAPSGVRRGGVWVFICIALATGSMATAAELEPAVGTFLVASRELRDPNFSRTVILLLRHNDEGTMGLVVNRRTDRSLAQLIPRLERLRQRSDRVYRGGPVMGGTLTMLMRADTEPEESNALIFENVYLSQDPKLLDRIVKEAEPDERIDFRVYTGYAGWAPGQLAAELERDDWQVVPADGDLVFDPQPGRVWERLSPKDPTRIANQDLSFVPAALCLLGAPLRGDP